MISEISKQIFTQLEANIIRNNTKMNEAGFTIDFKFNPTLANEFFNNEKIEPNCFIEPVNCSYNEETGLVSFAGKTSDFSSQKDFNKFLRTQIKDNDLSMIKLKEGNMLKTFIQERFLKSEVEFYNIDVLYSKSASTPPILRKSDKDGHMLIDAGKDLQYEVSDTNFVAGLVESMNKTGEYADRIDYDNKQEEKNKNKKTFKMK